MINTIRRLLGIGPKADYKELVKNGAIIIDVRTKGEYAGGHIKGSVNIPVDALSSSIAQLKDKRKAVITCCASGMRSASARAILRSNGFSEVYNGGSWISLQHKIK